MSGTLGKPITCRAAIAWGHNQPLTIESVEVAPPKAHEIRIKLVSASICHTDAHKVWREQPAEQFPMVLGHEGAGIVESVGEGVTTFKAGDHVIPCFQPQCRDCKRCSDPNTNLCLKRDATNWACLQRDGTSRITLKNGRACRQMIACSTFSEYTVVPEIQLAKIDEKAPLDKVCLIGCGVPTGYGAAVNVAKVKPASSCAIWGMGGIGLAVAMGCKANGATKIIGVDINSDKKEKAMQLGCTHFVNPTEHTKPIQEVIGDMTDGELCDYTFECIGNVNIMTTALQCARRGGGMSVIIGVPEAGKTASLAPFDLIHGRCWTGCFLGGYKSLDGIKLLVDDFMQGKMQIDPLITHTITLDEINKGFDLLREGKCIRTVIKY